MAELVAYSSKDVAESPEQEERRNDWQRAQDAAEPVLRRLAELAREQITLRKPVETRWLADLRQYWGQYDSAVESALVDDESRSGVFINITRPKTNAWAARLGDMLFPNDEKNWGIDPTPVPTLTRKERDIAAEAEKLEEMADQAAEEHNQMVDAGQVPEGMPTPAFQQAQSAAEQARQLREAEKSLQSDIEFARKRCQSMERLIDDQLTESKFPAICRDAIDDMCRVGVGIVKGPVVAGGGKRMWQVDDAGDATMVTSDDTNPTYRRVNYWHFFPDMNASSMDEQPFTFERHLPNRKALRKLAREMGFNPETVRKLLDPKRSEYGGEALTATDLSFLAELRGIENSDSVSDGSTLGPLKDRFVVWEYRGTLECEDICTMLRAAGRSDDADRFEADADPLHEMMVSVWFCEGMLLKIEEEYLLDSGASLYSVCSFEKAESSILGSVGVPRLLRDLQSMLNSSIRMIMDNGALAAAPQLVIDTEALQPVNGSWKLTPRKVWKWVRGAVTSAGKEHRPFETFEITLNQAQLAAIVDMTLKFVDEVVAMPMIAQGEQGAQVTKTAQGMSMLFNSANVVFRRVVKNYDDDMIGLITRTFDFNMQFSSRREVKGDAKIEARGTSVLLVREVQSQVLLEILNQWSVHPIMGVAFRAFNAMRMVLQAMSINPDDLLVSYEEYMAKLKQMAEGGPESPDAIRAQASIEVATITAESRKLESDTTLQIADMNRATEFAKLAQNRDLSLQQIEAMFRTKEVDASVKVETQRLKTQSDERKLAAEIAVERQAAADARARGEEPTGSGGTVSMGGKGPA